MIEQSHFTKNCQDENKNVCSLQENNYLNNNHNSNKIKNNLSMKRLQMKESKENKSKNKKIDFFPSQFELVSKKYNHLFKAKENKDNSNENTISIINASEFKEKEEKCQKENIIVTYQNIKNQQEKYLENIFNEDSQNLTFQSVNSINNDIFKPYNNFGFNFNSVKNSISNTYFTFNNNNYNQHNFRKTITLKKPKGNPFNVPNTIKNLNFISKVDEIKKDNPIYMYEYINTIHHDMIASRDKNISEGKGFLNFQNMYLEKNRTSLIEWFFEVQIKFKLKEETIHLAINLLDRILEKKSVLNLILLASTCLFIACKYEEIFCPEINDFIFISGDSFNKAQLLKSEYDILSSVEFDLNYSSAYDFLKRLSFIKKYNFLNIPLENTFLLNEFNTVFGFLQNNLERKLCSFLSMKIYFLALYILNVSFIELKLLKYDNIIKASACFLLARKLFRNHLKKEKYDFEIWDEELKLFSTYNYDELIEPSREIFEVFNLYLNSSLSSLKIKFSHMNYFSISYFKFN